MSARVLLVLLLAGDALYIALNFLYGAHRLELGGSSGPLHAFLRLFSDWHFSLQRDQGYSETYNYIKEFWMALLMLGMALNRRYWVYLPWAALFAYLLLDDSAGAHEAAAGALSRAFPVSFLPTDAETIWEALVMGGIGLVLIVPLVYAYRAAIPEVRRDFRRLVPPLALLVFFVVVMDLVNGILYQVAPNRLFNALMFTIGEGGEMIATSILTAAVFDIALRTLVLGRFFDQRR